MTARNQIAQEFLGDRIPPNDVEAERTVLSAMMQEPEAAEIGFEELRAEDFYHNANAELFGIMRDLSRESRNFDHFTLKREADKAGILEALGGDMGFINLSNAAPNAAMILEYAHIVLNLSRKRAQLSVATRMLRAAYDTSVDAFDTISRMEIEVHTLAERSTKRDTVTLAKAVKASIASFEEARANTRIGEILPTGLADLDRLLDGGFHESEYTLLAARPSVGKTTLAINIARHIAGEGIPVLFISLEMRNTELAEHMIAAEAKINGRLLRNKMRDADEGNLDRVYAAGSILKEFPVIIDDGYNQTVMSIRSKIRKYVCNEGVKIVFIDYLQLVNIERQETRNLEIAMISRILKSLASELYIPIVAVAQLKRPQTTHKIYPPVISDLRESGSLEQDADVILLLHRDDYQQTGKSKKGYPLRVIVGKNRNGATGFCDLTFLKEQYRIENYFPPEKTEEDVQADSYGGHDVFYDG